MDGAVMSLEVRTKQFALGVIGLYGRLPKHVVALVIGKQLLRAGTSVGAHYREAQRSRSNAEFVSKLGGGLQELEESRYWLELLDESAVCNAGELRSLLESADELTRILVACINNAKRKAADAAKKQRSDRQ